MEVGALIVMAPLVGELRAEQCTTVVWETGVEKILELLYKEMFFFCSVLYVVQINLSTMIPSPFHLKHVLCDHMYRSQSYSHST